jgi:hypothetical protein
VTRSLARRPKGSPQQSGLRVDTPTEHFAQAALRFWSDPANAQRPVEDLAKALVDAGNAELAKLKVRKVQLQWVKTTEARRGEFHADLWLLTLFPATIGVEPTAKVGDLSADQVSDLVRTIFHETRHAEQYFRVARVVAGEGDASTAADRIGDVFLMDSDAAAEAAGLPLSPGALTAKERDEVHDWRNSVDLYSNFEQAVVEWRRELSRVLTDDNIHARNDADDPNADAARAVLEKAIPGWDRRGALDFVRTMRDRVILRTMTQADARLLEDMQIIEREYVKAHEAFDVMERDWAQADEGTRLALVRAVRDALMPVGRQLSLAYTHMPNEADASDAGEAAKKRFLELAAARARA